MEEANCLKYFKEKVMENEEFRTYISVSSYHGIFLFISFFFSFFLNLLSPMVSDDLMVMYVMNNYLNWGWGTFIWL